MKRALLAFLLLAGVGPLASVNANLTSWMQDKITGSGIGGTFTVVSPATATFRDDAGSDGRGVMFSGSNDVNHVLRANVKVATSNDDDFFGFVIGYNNDDYTNAAANYVLVDWKQADQVAVVRFGGGPARDGLALSIVTDSVAGVFPGSGYAWGHSESVHEQTRASILGSTGWVDFQTYTLDIRYLPGRVQVLVDGVLELDYAGTISEGSFGLYGFSQDQIQFSNVSISPAVPVPGAILLGASGACFVGWLRRRRIL